MNLIPDLNMHTDVGVIILRKGPEDMVCFEGGDVYVLREQGSPRRCGGQGDVLAGILGVSLYWASSPLSGHGGAHSLLSGGGASPTGGLSTIETERELSWQEFEQSDLLAWRLPNYQESANTNTPVAKKQCVSDEEGPASSIQFEPCVAAALFSAAIVRRSAALAFKDKGRSVTSPDIIECIGSAFANLVPGDNIVS